jgi:hypothetical protein
MGQSDNSRIKAYGPVLSQKMLLPLALTCLVGFSGCSVSGLSASAFWKTFAGLPLAILAAPPGPAGPAGLPAPPPAGPSAPEIAKKAESIDTKTPDPKVVDPKNPEAPKAAGEGEEKKPAVVSSTPNANGFLMATEIILAGKNPFAVKLPKPQPDPTKLPDPNLVQGPGGQNPGGQAPVIVEKPLPPPDPFAQITLNGVLYNARTPLALISAGGEASKIVRKGDILMGTGGPVIITSITRSNVEVATLTNRKKRRTLTLPDIVGYIPQGGTGRKEKTPDLVPQSNDGQIIPPDSGQGFPPSGPTAGPPGGLSEGFPPVSGGKQKGPSINLKPILSGLEAP